MQYAENSNNNVAIVAIIVVGILIAGGVVMYFNGNFGGRDVVHRDTTTIIERTQDAAPAKEAAAVEPAEKESSGFTFKHESEDGTTTEVGTP